MPTSIKKVLQGIDYDESGVGLARERFMTFPSRAGGDGARILLHEFELREPGLDAAGKNGTELLSQFLVFRLEIGRSPGKMGD
jgi:hypothetical protein